MTRGIHLTLAAALILGAACGGDDDGEPATCPEGYREDGPACVPLYDPCDGDGEIPRFGGGCQAVGVTSCASGFEGDGGDGCEPVLPTGTCPAGTMARIGSPTCLEVGVAHCGVGFAPDGAGGCDPVLPAAPCGDDTLAVLGETTCQSLGACGSAPWGDVTADASTLFVDGSQVVTSPDGSAGAPFGTVAQALAAAAPGVTIVIAAGEYPEHLVLERPVRLVGRCATLVTLRGVEVGGTPRAPVEVGAQASGAELLGVTLTGAGPGLVVDGATGVVVQNARVRQSDGIGVSVVGGASVTLRRVLVTEARSRGMRAVGSTLRLEQSVVQDTRAASGAYGRGIQAECDVSANRCGTLTLDRSILQRNRDSGLVVFGADTAITASVIRDTAPRSGDDGSGRGITAQCDYEVNVCGTLTVTGSVIAGNHDVGVFTQGFDTRVVDSVVRDTLPQVSDGDGGRGISSQCDGFTDQCGSVWVERCQVTGNHTAGIAIFGEKTVVLRSAVLGTSPRPADDLTGRGIDVQCDPELGDCGAVTVVDSLVADNHDLGVLVTGAPLFLRGVQVRGTRSRGSDGKGGYGVGGQCDADPAPCHPMVVTECLLEENREIGLLALGLEVTLVGSVVRGTTGREEDDVGGSGVVVACDAATGRCGDLTLTGGLVAGNHETGLYAVGGDAVVTESIIRDTEARGSDGLGGRGVEVQCHSGTGDCGVVQIGHSLVVGNRDAGLFVAGAELVVHDSVVRDQRASVAHTGGSGAVAVCDPVVERCGALQLERCLFARNQTSGVAAAGGTVFVAASRVRDTVAQEGDGVGGRGIDAQCDVEVQVCGSLEVVRSVLSGNRDAGIAMGGVPAELIGVRIQDTEAAQTSAGGDFGQGIVATCPVDVAVCGALQVTHCHVTRSVTAGIAVSGVSGSVETSLVEQIAARPMDDAFGYGLQLDRGAAAAVVFHVDRCVVREAALAGILFAGTGGRLSGSVVGETAFPVVLDSAATPDIAGDNQLEGRLSSEPTFAQMDPAPTPPALSPQLPSDIETPTRQ